ncbi:transcription factor E2F4-like [Cottoperca gobio]|uniref:Transcription factor E2F4-like n=1 Tax=Cottoperca gobio TaxID=56716 RepID=A0A6J2RP81_COTGO|nr:transcription factor E2F4-like [Cottoperca gobio]XP_029312698.1 transcription factor E2F4-like [Cottoperca gobio]XP_029312705.1 transcription factor E2F4-like [Cottoperca gobio]XP_029312713.1 transcription factor E2F4-like [Cottoperca gobio]XP_029312723.1 transcription factor E2F4-like [Cottoperca gobio]XP_029312732.1 transcription factor E2F4-like [Cottoperca gobio]
MDPEGCPLNPDHGSDRETATPDQNPKFQRSLRSLHMLTTRFVRLLQEAESGELDLRHAVKVLAVGQKRRIYDITNVLEGVGLIVKISKSVVKWKGAMPGETAHVLGNRLIELKSELEDLEQKECMLDQQKFWVEQSTRNTREDCSDLTYVNHEDICNCFTGRTLLAVRAPRGTQLDVPIPKAVQNSPAKYQIHLKSVNGPIDVVLLNKLSVSSVPVVLPVPPSEELLRNAKSAMSTSDDTESSIAACQASANTKSRRTAIEDMRHLQSLLCLKAEPNRIDSSDSLRDLSKELRDLLNPTKEVMNTDLIKELMASEVFSPLVRLSPPPSENEYAYNLDESEGLCDLFDVPMLNV